MRQMGEYKGNPSQILEVRENILDETSIYDWIIDIDLMTTIASSNWTL